MMKKYLPFSRRQPSLDRFVVGRSGWSGSDKFNGKSLRRTSGASLNARSIQVVRGAYNIDLNKVDSSFTKLHRACLLNDDAQVRKHLQKIDNNTHDSSHRYPIHLATVNGNLAILKILIENGANANVQDNEGNTPLIKSIECGHEHLVKFFLSNGADPNQSDMDNNTALHWAITTESIIAIEALLSSQKCDLSLRNNKDETCLHLAVRSPLINTSTFETMLRCGADLQAKDQLGLTALDIAQACNNKVAMNAFSRVCPVESGLCSGINNNDSAALDDEVSDKQADGEQKQVDRLIDDDPRSVPNATSGIASKNLIEGYKNKYQVKNMENLEYEKKHIQMTAQIERLKLDIGYLREKNDSLKSEHNRLIEENSKLKQENSKLIEQVKIRKRQNSVGRSPSSSSSERPSSQRGETHEDDSVKSPTTALTLEHPDETIECRSHKEFMVARRMNQEWINKLKNGLLT